MTVLRRRHRAHLASSGLSARHDGSASPHVSQSGGVSGGRLCQQASQTAPRVGIASGRRQAAQTGASSTATSASETALAHVDALRVTPEALE